MFIIAIVNTKLSQKNWCMFLINNKVGWDIQIISLVTYKRNFKKHMKSWIIKDIIVK